MREPTPPTEPDFSAAFTADSLDGTPLERVELPRLRVPSGRIVVCDPWIEAVTAPLEQPVPPGEHRVQLAMATLRLSKRRTIALPGLARVVFDELPAVRWVMATRPEQALAELRPGHRHGHGVDSGVSAFMDPIAHAALLDAYADMVDVDEPALLTELREAMDGSPEGHFGAVDVRREDEPMTNVVACMSGAGDGHYTSWWGYTEDGAVAELVTDFALTGRPPP